MDTLLGPIYAAVLPDQMETTLVASSTVSFTIRSEFGLLADVYFTMSDSSGVKVFSYLEQPYLQAWLNGPDPTISDFAILRRRRLIEKVVILWAEELAAGMVETAVCTAEISRVA